MTALAVAIVLTFLGLALVVAGVRGKSVVGSRMCGRCGFDLAGITPAVCPECGAGLGASGGVVVKRVRLRAAIWSGAALLLVSVAATGTLAWAIATRFDPLPHLPVWAVRMEGRSESEARSLRALAEIVRRMEAGTLPDQDLQLVVDNAIARIEGMSEPSIQWSEFIESVRGRGQLSDAKWLAYAKAAVDVDIFVRDKVRRGEKVLIKPTLDGRRAASPTFRGAGAKLRIRQWMREGSVGGRVTKGAMGISSISTVQRGSRGGMGNSLKTDGKTGRAIIRVTLQMDVLNEKDNNAIGGWSREFVREIEVLEPDAALIREVKDLAPELIRQSLNIGSAWLREDGRVSINLDVNTPPSGIGFEVLIRPVDGGSRAEVPAGQLGVAQGYTISHGFTAKLSSNTATLIDVILRPSREAAEAAECVESVWMGPDIVFRAVPLEWER